MARQRRPVPSLQEALIPRITPQAAPVARDSVVRPPDDLPIYDFAAISSTIASHLRKQQEQRNKQAELAGERFAEENRLIMADLQVDLAGVKDPAERDRIQKETFAFLRRLGDIPDMADPNVRIGLERANGRILVGQYWQNLQRRLNDVSVVIDPQTGQPREPLAAEAVMAEEWQKIADAPAVKGYYGGQEALGQKVSADAQFLQEVTRRRSAAEKSHYEQTIAGELGKTFDAILAQNDAVSSAELQPITAYIEQEMEQHNLLNPRETVLSALELSFRRLSAIDPKEALRAVHAAQDIVISGVRLGDDRSGVGERLQELTRQVREDAKTNEELEIEGEDRARTLAIQRAQADYLPTLLAAKRDGVSIRQVARSLEKQYLAEDEATGRFGGRGAFVVQAMQKTAEQLEADSTTDPDVLHAINEHIAHGRLDAAQALADAALADRRLSGSDYAQGIDLIRKRGDVSQYMEDDPLYQSTLNAIDGAIPRGFAPEIQDGLEQQGEDLKLQFSQQREAVVRANRGKPNEAELNRQSLNEMGAQYRKAVAELGKDRRVKRDEATRAIAERLTRFQDASDLIDQAVAEGAITIPDSLDLKKANIQAGLGREELLGMAQREAAQLLDARIEARYGGPPQDQNGITIQETARRRLRDQLGLGLDAMIADPSVDPRTFPSRARAIANQTADEIGDKLFPAGAEAAGADRRAIERGLEAGESAEQVEARVKQLTTERAVSADLERTLATPLARESFQATHPIFQPAQEGAISLHTDGVPPRFYEYAAGWWSARDPIFGNPVDRETMVGQVRDLGRSLADSPDRDRILTGALDVLGVDALQVVRGEALIEPDPAERAYILRSIDSMQAGMAVNLFTRGRTQAQIEELRARLEPMRIPLAGHKWKPHLTAFFRDREELDKFSNDPAYPEFLRAVGLDPGNEEEIKEWVSYQTAAIARSSQ